MSQSANALADRSTPTELTFLATQRARRDVSEPGSADADRLFLTVAEMAEELSVVADIIEHMSD